MKRSKRSQTSSGSTRTSKPLPAFCRAFVKRVQNSAFQQGLWNGGEKCIVAVSGGPDSLCLLDIFAYLGKKYRFSLHVAHVNYGLRGAASDLDEALVREQAGRYGIPVSVFRPKRTRRGNLEERLREERYAFFERLRKKLGYDVVAVGHHEDDQAETVLLRLLRGAGLEGLSAMRAKSGRVIRPLLAVSRLGILRYLKERGIKYREDESNLDRRFLRNRVRHELIPLLERDFQPNIRKVLARTASTIASDYDSFAAADRDFFGKAGTFSRWEALAMPESELARALRGRIKALSGKAPAKGTVDECLKALKSTKKKPQTVVFGGLKLERKDDRVTLLKSAD